MFIRSKRDLIRNIAEMLRSVYSNGGQWDYLHDKRSTKDVYEQLLNLPKDAAESDVAAIIGNYSWTSNICDECGEDVHVTVFLGEDTDDASYVRMDTCTAAVCYNCLMEAQSLINKEVKDEHIRDIKRR